MLVTWPHSLDWRMHSMPKLIGQSQPPQQSISGAVTRIPRMGARWQISASFLIHGEARELAYSAFIGQMQGDLGTSLVPVWSRYRPKDRDGQEITFNEIASLSGAQTWEHFGFENQDIPRISVVFDAPLRATELDLTNENSTGIRPGQFFSVNNRLHRVRQQWQIANRTRVRIEPPLREAVSAGDQIEVERPVCPMFITDEGMTEYNINGAFMVELTFEESI